MTLPEEAGNMHHHQLYPSIKEDNRRNDIEQQQNPVHNWILVHICFAIASDVEEADIHEQNLDNLAINVVVICGCVIEGLDLDDGEDAADHDEDGEEDLDFAGVWREVVANEDDEDLSGHHDHLPEEHFGLEPEEDITIPQAKLLNSDTVIWHQIWLHSYQGKTWIGRKRPWLSENIEESRDWCQYPYQKAWNDDKEDQPAMWPFPAFYFEITKQP